MPSGVYTQEKTVKQEEKVIAKLLTIERDPMISSVYQRQARMLLEGKHFVSPFCIIEFWYASW